MVFLSSIEKDSVATTRDFFKDCIFACKIRNQIHKNFEKEKFHKQPVVNLLKNGFSVRHVFYTVFFLYLWPKSFKNKFEVVHT